MSERIYLSPPHMGGEELTFIQDAFEKNWIAPLGENVDNFEKDLANYTGRDHAGAFTSGTASIHLGLKLIGVEAGDEVICQSFTFTATVNPVRYLNAIPVLIDSEPRTWNMDPELLRKAVEESVNRGKKPRAILPVHLYGMPAEMEEILNIAGEYDIPVLEDAAEALGSVYKGRMCGDFGTCSVLSFNGNKIITTSGGGALLSDDEVLIDKARFLATQARDPAPHYQHSQVGYNYRMSNVVAGIGRGQMKVLDNHIQQRRSNHDFYFQALGKTWLDLTKEDGEIRNRSKSTTGIYFLKEPEEVLSNRWLTTIIVNPDETGGITREEIRLMLDEENIESRPLWKPMHQQPVCQEFPAYTNGFSDWLFRHGLCLPSGSAITETELKRICTLILDIIKGERAYE